MLFRALLLCTLTLFVRGQSADPDFSRALELHRAGDLAGAAAAYESVIAAHPDRFDARSNLGAVLAKLGRYKEAIEQYSKALESAPPAAAAHLRMNLALALYKSFQIPQAVEQLTQLHAQAPDDSGAALLLADCYLRLGEFKKVIEILTPLEPAQPGNLAITYMLGTALIRDGQVRAGQTRVDTILKQGDSAEASLMLGAAMFAAHDYPGAVKTFAHAVELNPALPSAHSFYGQALLMTGDADGAAEAFRKELASNPADYEANLYLGQILQRRHKPSAAVATESSGVAVGAEAPDFAELGLRRYRGKRPVALVFGSYTCPQFRGAAGDLNAMFAKYGARVQFLMVYIREAHAGAQWQSSINEREGISMQPASNMAEKTEHATLCTRKLKIGFPSAVDGMQGAIESAYDAWPSRVYLIGRDGRVAYNSRLSELDFQAAQLEDAIRKALAP